MRNIKNLFCFLVFSVLVSCGGGKKNADAIKNALGLNCSFSPIEGSSTIEQEITSGNSLTVACDEVGYHGGGNWYCKYDGKFDGKECEKNSFNATGYALKGFHCDLDEDGEIDEGEDIDFPDHSFVSKWRVGEGDLNIELPIIQDERLDFYVDWGDGKCSRVRNEDFEKRIHTYNSPDDYQVRIIGKVFSWGGSNSNANYRRKLIEVVELGDVYWENLKNAFSDLPNLTSFKAIYSNTSSVTNMASMFQNSSNLLTLILDGMTTQLVEDMSYMFSGLEITELDIDHFITPKLINMEGMFSGMPNVTTVKINGMITKNVTTMENLFYDSLKLASIEFGDYFETISVTNMAYMFSGTKIVNLDLSFFNTSSVINMEGMFMETTSLTNIIFGDYFITENVTNMIKLFYGCGVSSLDLSNFNTVNVTDMSYMFGDTINITNIIFGNYFVTKNVTNMYYMFGGSGISELDHSLWDTSLVTNMARMFYNTVNVTNIFLGEYFVTTNVTDMSEMFYGSNVNSLDLQYFNNINVTNIYGIFQNTINLSSLTLPTSNFVTSNVTNLSDVFNNAGNASLTALDLSSWDTSSVTNMSSLFEDTGDLTTLTIGGNFNTNLVTDFSHFLDSSGVSNFNFSVLDTSCATDLSFMLANMSNQEIFDLTNFDTANVTTVEGMLQNLGSVTDLDISSFDTDNVTNFDNFLGETTLDNAETVNLGDQTNDDIIPADYDLTTLTVDRICRANLTGLHADNALTSANSYFVGTLMTLTSSDGAIGIKCTEPSKRLSSDVTVVCDVNTGEIIATAGTFSFCF